jgi:predicted nucleic acid-binding protein
MATGSVEDRLAAHEAKLLTKNKVDFDTIPELTTEDWTL